MWGEKGRNALDGQLSVWMDGWMAKERRRGRRTGGRGEGWINGLHSFL